MLYVKMIRFYVKKHCDRQSEVHLDLHIEQGSDNRCSVLLKRSNGRLAFVFFFLNMGKM